MASWEPGDIRFISNFVIGVQIVLKNNDPAVMLAQLDRAYWFVRQSAPARQLADEPIEDYATR